MLLPKLLFQKLFQLIIITLFVTGWQFKETIFTQFVKIQLRKVSVAGLFTLHPITTFMLYS